MQSAGLVISAKMFKFSAVVLLVSVIYYTQCLPTQTTQSDTKTETDSQLQLYVNNGTEATNYHLTQAISELQNEDQMINAELNAIMPYLNFLLGPVDGDGLACMDQMEIQLIHD